MIPFHREGFDFQHRTRVVFGSGRIRELGKLAAEIGAQRVLVVSDPGVVAAGHFDIGKKSLLSAGLEVESFHALHENPTDLDVDAGVRIAKLFHPDCLVGLGGGSSMDCAKGINFVYCCGGRMQDYWGVGKATRDLLPLIAVPTTAGTGSEAQSFSLISDSHTHVKMACGDPRAACRIALLDPDLTLTQPPRVAALTGLDAISHAIETYVSKRHNPLSQCYSREAWRLLSRGFPRILQDGNDIEARSQMQLGAFFAGLAIEASMLGGAHATANPLTSHFGIIHGQAVAVMLPHVIRFNRGVAEGYYRDLWELLSPRDGTHATANGSPSGLDVAEALAMRIDALTAQSGLATRLRDLNVARESLSALAHDATKQWTGQFNPREITEPAALALYESAF